MKKLLALALSSLLVLSLAACGGDASTSTAGSAPGSTSTPSASTPASTPDSSADGKEIAMITDIGDIDDKSFNQGTYEGVKAFAEANGKTYQYYKPTEQSDAAYLESIELAIENGAKVVVTPGYLFENAVGEAQTKYTDVHFLLIDSTPKVKEGEGYVEHIENNAVGITFAEEQTGYLAGYAAVKDGYTKLGFMGGMAVPAVVRFGFGYVQGANDAAKELGVTVDMMYHYTGGFDATPEAQSMAAGWYNAGTEVIFGCGGAVGNSVFRAAESAGKKSIGVDIDQSGESETVITSSIKGLKEAVSLVLGQFYEGKFPGGQAIVLGAKDDAVGLPMETSKFETFTQADYDAIFAQIADGSVAIAGDAGVVDGSGNPSVNPTDLDVALDNVNLTFVG